MQEKKKVIAMMPKRAIVEGMLVMTCLFGRCDSNPAQYERNRRFGQLAHTVARPSNAVKLPSVGL